MALSEACTNVFRHAGLDSGSGFGRHSPASVMPDPSAERGRGLALIRAFTDQASFDSVMGDGGAVHLAKNLRWADEAPLQPPPGRSDRSPRPAP